MNTYKVIGYNWEMTIDVNDEIFDEPFIEAATKATEKVFNINSQIQTSDKEPAALGKSLHVHKIEKTGGVSEIKTFQSELVFLNASLWRHAELSMALVQN